MLRAKKKIRKLEKKFIARSSTAFATAFKNAQSSGLSVVISDKGSIYRVLPDGSRILIKKIEPPTRVKAGQKVIIR